jgi:RNA polymerase sigma factor (sigma-70 family)
MLKTMVTKYATTLDALPSSNEAELVLAAQNGDLEAFNQIVLLYQDRIFALAFRILGDGDSAEDLTQNAFLAAYRNLSGFRNGSFRSWLYRIATNACYDEIRRRKRHPLLSLEYEDEVEERFLPTYELPDSRILPEKEYERHELKQVIQQALNQLEADQRAVVVLVDVQDFDYQEAAQILGIPVGTVRSRLARARLRLRSLLGSVGIDKQL